MLPISPLDPTPVFDLFRSNFATELLTAAVAHLDAIEALRDEPLTEDQWRSRIGIESRPATVLATALRAMQLLSRNAAGQLELTTLARDFLLRGSTWDMTGYIRLASDAPGVLATTARLKTNRPAGAGARHDAHGPETQGTAFIYREGTQSAMEQADAARFLTLALSGRAKVVAPVFARKLPLGEARCLLDIGGGTGLFSIACLLENPRLRSVVWDRPQVLKVAEEFGCEQGVLDRLELRPGDMFADPVPNDADCILLSNVLHDWDIPECRQLIARCAAALPPGGRLVIHDAFLDDDLGGPLPLALYSANLFALTEGRAYSAGEYRGWLTEAGLVPGEVVPTHVHCSLLVATKPH